MISGLEASCSSLNTDIDYHTLPAEYEVVRSIIVALGDVRTLVIEGGGIGVVAGDTLGRLRGLEGCRTTLTLLATLVVQSLKSIKFRGQLLLSFLAVEVVVEFHWQVRQSQLIEFLVDLIPSLL